MKLSRLEKLWISTWPILSNIFPKQTAKWAEILFLTPERIQRPTSELDYFNTAKKFKIQNRIAAFEWGDPTHPLVVLVHGWSGRGTQMGAFAQPLVHSGFRVVALDGPAHGDSDGQLTHVGEYSQFLIDIQKDLGPYRAIIAHSFGAGCSVYSATLGLKVDKIVLIAGPSRYELVVRYYLTSLKLSKNTQEYFIKMISDRVKLPVSAMNVGVLGKTLSIPALVIHDKEDKEVPYQAAEEIKSNWPSVELILTTGLGHRRILKDPQIVNTVKDFILKD
jgi:pimeloyl-ACP methyl ester carboxylesterase